MPFVPGDFQIPTLLETGRFRLRPLTIHDVVKDYDAMMSRSDTNPDLTLEQNLIDLGWHQFEFQRRRSFTFTVMSLDEHRCLGCVYIYPPREGRPEHDARVFLWVRKTEEERGLEPVLQRTVETWIAAEWPFERPWYGGRDPD